MAKKPRNRRSGRKARAAERARVEKARVACGYEPPKARKVGGWRRFFSR